MESEQTSTEPGRSFFASLDGAEPLPATEALKTLSDGLHRQGKEEIDLARAWEAFQRLLERRGYYVDTPARLAESLREIEAVGTGFDLYDLAQSLARYDVVRTRCRKLSGSRTLPELTAFAATCSCRRRRNGKET